MNMHHGPKEVTQCDRLSPACTARIGVSLKRQEKDKCAGEQAEADVPYHMQAMVGDGPARIGRMRVMYSVYGWV